MSENIPLDFYISSLPILLLAMGSLVYVLFPSMKGQNQLAYYIFSLLLLGSSLAALLFVPLNGNYWNGAFLSDGLSFVGNILLLAVAILLVLLYKESCLASRFFSRDSLSLFILSLIGMMVLVSSTDLATLFVGLELSSIGLYVLVGYLSPSRTSMEGAVKYLILGSFASAFLLFGFGLLYACSGTMNLAELAQRTVISSELWLQLGIVFSLIGLAFKLALVPFHMWAPDAYEAAPTGITAFMATSVKIMILVVALRLTQGLSLYGEQWNPLIAGLAFLSMVGGNLLALVQTSMKRMLAYSSISHSGYMAIVLCALGGRSELPFQAILFYLIAYTLSSLLAFGTLMWLEDKEKQNLHLSDLRGLMHNHPWAAFAIAVSMFSFAGMPPTVGFIAKFFVFNAAIRENLYFLVFAGVAGSIISLYYYLRVIVFMYMQKPSEESALRINPAGSSFMSTFVLGLTCAVMLALGTVFPGALLDILKSTATHLLQR